MTVNLFYISEKEIEEHWTRIIKALPAALQNDPQALIEAIQGYVTALIEADRARLGRLVTEKGTEA